MPTNRGCWHLGCWARCPTLSLTLSNPPFTFTPSVAARIKLPPLTGCPARRVCSGPEAAQHPLQLQDALHLTQIRICIGTRTPCTGETAPSRPISQPVASLQPWPVPNRPNSHCRHGQVLLLTSLGMKPQCSLASHPRAPSPAMHTPVRSLALARLHLALFPLGHSTGLPWPPRAP